jgi:hypothetical protein
VFLDTRKPTTASDKALLKLAVGEITAEGKRYASGKEKRSRGTRAVQDVSIG